MIFGFRNKGQTVAEFLLISSIFFPLALGSFQLAMLINAHQAVKLAAYRSARSLIVNINSSKLNETLKEMKSSAIKSLINVSPFLKNLKDIPKLTSNLSVPDAFSNFISSGMGALELFMRYSYANRYTKVSIESPRDVSKIERGSKVKVRVDFMFNLGVPLAGRIFYKLIKYKNLFSNSLVNSMFDDIPIPEDLNPLGSSLRQIKISKSVTMQAEN